MGEQELPWSVIDTYFKDNPRSLVQHHLNSFNDFFGGGIQRIMKERNPISLIKQQNPETKEFRLRCDLYFGGKDGTKIYFGKPIIYDDEGDRSHFMYPNEARLRNMTYGTTIHYDIDVVYTMRNDDGTVEEVTNTIQKVFLGRFPIMLMSNQCILQGMEPRVRYNMGECRNDHGGYFIIDGKEKCIISQEKFADNMLYIRDKGNELYSHSAEIRSVSEDASKPVRTVGVRIVRPTPKFTNNQIVVSVPNVRKPVPLFILMRALGVESDRDIITYCLLDLDKYKHYIDLFIPSVHDAGTLFTQDMCIRYIASLTKASKDSTASVIDILMNYFLPHIGELNFKEKAYFVGYMVRELLMVFTGDKKPTDRDNFKFKRIETSGGLLYDLFKEYYVIQQKSIRQGFDRKFFGNQGNYSRNMESWIHLIEGNYNEVIEGRGAKEPQEHRIVELGFRKAFKGNWGSASHTKRDGIVQDLNRLSFNSFISQLRKCNLPLDASAKVIGPRMLHSSQWGIIDPVDTPDGANIGLHKHMAIAAQISSGCSATDVTKWIATHISFKTLQESDNNYLANTTKVMVNGNWIGNTPDPEEAESLMRDFRRLGLLPLQFSVHWHVETNILYVYTDAGRLYRPVYYIDKKTSEPSYRREGVLEKIVSGSASWQELVSGFAKKQQEFDVNGCKVYDSPEELYGVKELSKLETARAPIEFIDTAEEETALIAMDVKQLGKAAYTHLEIHPSLMLGVMGNQIVFPENNQLPRDLFSCGQSKQGISVYHSNFMNRIDKTGIVLNYGQIPVVKSRYMEYLNREQHPYGENLIVAIMCYGGYNTEDAILFNGGSVARGMLHISYYNSYEAYEESSSIGGNTVDSVFANVQDHNVIGIKPGYDYGHLDKYGLIKENTQIDEKMVVIGKITTNLSDPETSLDSSVFPKKGQKGFVDKTFITEGQEGKRIAKVRIREQRPPSIGDKFCSRCGQKGTCGLIIDERDMPFTANGVRPDIIINPHALPSRMTIGQLVETVMGKACVMEGAFGDCTAFSNKGPKHKVFGDILLKNGFHSSGNEVLYNGLTGEEMEMSIFMGPTYYMRLKQMVKDKINYRARGPRTVLTRQTVHGRANDGGLRVGEMERDSLIAHGLSAFLEESMMVRGDEYYMAVCNTTGAISVYNESRGIFLSPYADGPIKYTDGLDGKLKLENISKFGKTFSIVRVPYAFKLLMQELQTMNIQMRIITEDNIDQLTSMESHRELRLKLGLSEEVDLKEYGRAAKELLRPSRSSGRNYYQQTDGDEPRREPYGVPYYGDEQQRQEDIDPFAIDQEVAARESADAKRQIGREIDLAIQQLQKQSNLQPEVPQYADAAGAGDDGTGYGVGEPSMPGVVQVQGGPSFVPGEVLAPTAPAQQDTIRVQRGPTFVPGGFLPGNMQGGQPVEANANTQEQQGPSVQVAAPQAGGTVLQQTIVVGGQRGGEDDSLKDKSNRTPDDTLQELQEAEDAKTNDILQTIGASKQDDSNSLTVNTSGVSNTSGDLNNSLLHNIVDDLKPDEDDQGSTGGGVKKLRLQN